MIIDTKLTSSVPLVKFMPSLMSIWQFSFYCVSILGLALIDIIPLRVNSVLGSLSTTMWGL